MFVYSLPWLSIIGYPYFDYKIYYLYSRPTWATIYNLHSSGLLTSAMASATIRSWHQITTCFKIMNNYNVLNISKKNLRNIEHFKLAYMTFFNLKLEMFIIKCHVLLQIMSSLCYIIIKICRQKLHVFQIITINFVLFIYSNSIKYNYHWYLNRFEFKNKSFLSLQYFFLLL